MFQSRIHWEECGFVCVYFTLEIKDEIAGSADRGPSPTPGSKVQLLPLGPAAVLTALPRALHTQAHELRTAEDSRQCWPRALLPREDAIYTADLGGRDLGTARTRADQYARG